MFTYPTPFQLLEEAETVLTSHPSLLRRAKKLRAKRFSGGALWMLEALSILREKEACLTQQRYEWYGAVKYGLALFGGVITALLSYHIAPLWITPIAFLISFYAVEAQFVFLFPILIDGKKKPIRESRSHTLKAGGTVQVVSTVLPIAFVMLLGGFLGKGFLQSWCQGCLAVVLWYEKLGTKDVELPQGLTLFNRSKLSTRSIAVSGLGQEKILYISDLHLTRRNATRILQEIREIFAHLNPSATILGGDLVDNSTGLAALEELTEEMSRMNPVLVIAGNHDRYLGVTKVRRSILESGGIWLADQSFFLRTSKGEIRFVAREGIEEASLLESQNNVLVYVGHDPAELRLIPKNFFHLALFGHLHGGQAVFLRFGQKLFPGAIFYPENQLSFYHGTTQVYVSRGVTDTLPIRWNCPREVLVCQM